MRIGTPQGRVDAAGWRHALAVLALVAAGAVSAQPYPSKTIKVLLGFPAGGAPDTALRRIASRLERRLVVCTRRAMVLSYRVFSLHCTQVMRHPQESHRP